jgi:hypothetical protein
LRIVPAVVVALLALGSAACSHSGGGKAETSTTARAVDTQQVESVVLATQKRATPTLDVRDPSCPARVVVTEGATFRCTVVLEGVIVPYDVTLKNVNSGSKTGSYDIQPAAAIILVSKLVDALQRNAPGTNIDCGPQKILVVAVGATFDCQATRNLTTQKITLKVDDLSGNVTQVTSTTT